MKIALVHEMLVKLGGAERVLKKLSILFPDAPIYTLVHHPGRTNEWFSNRKIVTSALQKYYDVLGNHRILLPKMSRVIEAFDFSQYDAVISSSSAFAHGIKTGKNTRHICYCHSPMRYAWDYAHQYLKGMNPLSRTLANLSLHRARIWDYETRERPDVLLCNSIHVQKRIRKYWRRDAEVVYPPINLHRFQVHPKNEGYFLIVSALTPFKRIELAVEAFNQNGHPLLIIGEGPRYGELKAMARPNVELLGYKPDDVVRDYLEHCRALIFPGEEDFGITPVEAMACGKPVLAYGKGGCLETIRAGVSGEFFGQPTAKSLQKGLENLMRNETKYDPLIIRKSAERFDGRAFEERIQKIIAS